jgi:hypothetical protein
MHVLGISHMSSSYQQGFTRRVEGYCKGLDSINLNTNNYLYTN